MNIAIIKDGSITVGDYRALFPNTAFPSSGPSEEFLAENSAKKVNAFKAHDRLTEKLVQVEPYDDGEFVSVVSVENLSTQEIQTAKDSALANIRSQRNQLLAACDWTQIPDCTIANKTAWATYRQALRDFPESIDDPRVPVEFPHDPDWKQVNV